MLLADDCSRLMMMCHGLTFPFLAIYLDQEEVAANAGTSVTKMSAVNTSAVTAVSIAPSSVASRPPWSPDAASNVPTTPAASTASAMAIPNATHTAETAAATAKPSSGSGVDENHDSDDGGTRSVSQEEEAALTQVGLSLSKRQSE